jgi:hypothetical protein
VLVEHLLQARHRHGGELAPGQFGEAVEVQQLALREQHHQGADLVVEQHGLHPRSRRQVRVFGTSR